MSTELFFCTLSMGGFKLQPKHCNTLNGLYSKLAYYDLVRFDIQSVNVNPAQRDADRFDRQSVNRHKM